MYAKAMYRLGDLEDQSAYYDKAFLHLQDAFSLYYRHIGMKDDTCAVMCWALTMSMVRKLLWEEADSMLTQVVEEAQRNNGISEPAKISLRWCLGNVYHNQRKYMPAGQIYEQCKSDLEAIDATKSYIYCLTLSTLSSLNDYLDNIEESIRLSRIGLDLHRQIYGAGHLGSVAFLSRLAFSNRRLGNWNTSIAYFEEINSILREQLGEGNWPLGMAMYNLGNLYTQMGDYIQAKRLHEESLRIILNTQGEKHSDYPMLLSALGKVAQLQKDYDTADSLFQESLRARIEILGKRHPYYPAGLADLASVYLDKNQPAAADPLLKEALTVQREIEGPRHHSVAATLQQLALCRLYEGRYAEADSIMGLSGELHYTIFGDNSPTTARYNDNRMLVRMCLDRKDKQIMSWAEHGQKIWKNTAQLAMGYASAQQMESLLFSLSFHNDLINVIAAEGNAAGLAYDNALLFKNLALQSRAEMFKMWNTGDDTAAAARLKSWQQIQRRLAGELSKPVTKRVQVDSLESLLQELERDLVVGKAAEINEMRIPDWHAVRDALRPGEAAIEFVHYTVPKPLPDNGAVRYAAILLLPGDPSPQFVSLMEEGHLIALLERQMSEAGAMASRNPRSGNLLDERPRYGAELCNLVWMPVARLLPRRVRTVYISLSGLLNRVNFSALPIRENKLLADRYVIRQIGSTRQLLRQPNELTIANATAVLYGGIRYTFDSTALNPEAIAVRSAAQERPMERLAAGVNRNSGFIWGYLPGAESEVTYLNDLLRASGFNTQLFTGWSATEEQVKTLGYDGAGGPDVLHIATHGYFFPDSAPLEVSALNTFSAHQHPLFRSGLILAGAEYAWRSGRSYGDMEDGILTAYEISQLNLSNTKLVVLSACETALGDIRGSEGVYGLQRAFKMAGVDYQIVSLWPVPDEETSEFMEAFYKFWLGGKTIHEAFAKAQQKMRKKYKEVYKWGAWVLIE